MDKLKVPPHSIEAEQSVLGAILITGGNDQKCREIFDTLTPAMFFNASHQVIYSAICDLKNKTIDLLTVDEYLQKIGKSEQSGGFSYLAELAKNTPSAANVLVYADMVRQRATLRDYIGLSNNALEMAYNGCNGDEIEQLLTSELQKIEKHSDYTPTHLKNVSKEYIDLLESRQQGKRSAVGLKTGISAIDNQIGGILPGWLVVLAGRPSMGKTLISQLISAHISRTDNVQFFSMEMGRVEIMDRYISIIAGIDPSDLKSGHLSEYGYARVSDALAAMQSNTTKLHYDDTPGLSVNQIKARSRATKKRLGSLGLIVIDYLGLMPLPKADRHDIAIGEVTRQIKELAKELQTPILLLAQANRETDKHARPTMANLKDSSSIEADADLVMFVHRQDVNDHETAFKGVTELIPVKYRHGDCNIPAYIERKGSDQTGYKYTCLEPQEVEYLRNIEAEKKADYAPRKKTYARK